MLRRNSAIVLAAAVAAVSLGFAAETPKPLVATYAALADAILGSKHAESALVSAILDGHRQAARRAIEAGNLEEAAAEIALFANEGDNAVGGIRKRLLEGGHHHNAEGEAKGLYEPGFVLVTKQAQQAGLALVAKLRKAGTDAERRAVFAEFDVLADSVLKAR